MRRLPWPLPALLAWLLAWALFALGTRWLALPEVAALLLATAVGLVLAGWAPTWWRRSCIAGGFPLSFVLTLGASSAVPAWAWLLLAAMLLLVYPLHAWRDAPLFPTPLNALDVLPGVLSMPAGARVLDAGCGLGHGLRALRRAYPGASLEGVEHSPLLAAACALRCPWARVRRGDMWRRDWSAYDLVYLFQRPESMERALAKAQAELAEGAWLVSLAFSAPQTPATLQLATAGGHTLWCYRMGGP